MTESTEPSVSQPSKIDLSTDLEAMKAIGDALSPLGEQARRRVMTYILTVFQIKASGKSGPSHDAGGNDESGEEEAEAEASIAPKYDSFADLFEAAKQPENNSDKALVAGYWLQVCQGADSFGSQSANTALKNLGHAILNITVALGVLIKQKPALVLQTKKSGKSRQARKTFKLTVAGIKAVEDMING